MKILRIQIDVATLAGLTRILHEKKMVNSFQAFKIRLTWQSRKGIRRDRLYPRSRLNSHDLNAARFRRHSRAGGNPVRVSLFNQA